MKHLKLINSDYYPIAKKGEDCLIQLETFEAKYDMHLYRESLVRRLECITQLPALTSLSLPVTNEESRFVQGQYYYGKQQRHQKFEEVFRSDNQMLSALKHLTLYHLRRFELMQVKDILPSNHQLDELKLIYDIYITKHRDAARIENGEPGLLLSELLSMQYTSISKYTVVELKCLKVDVKLPGFDEDMYAWTNQYNGIKLASAGKIE